MEERNVARLPQRRPARTAEATSIDQDGHDAAGAPPTAEGLQAALQAGISRGISDTGTDRTVSGVVRAAGDVLLDSAFATFADISLPYEGVPDVPEPTNDHAPWWDLRPSEALRLYALVEAAVGRAIAACEAAIVDELVTAGLRFSE
jgi:hypothetical protein